MKIFKFDPKTGRRGDFIENAQRPSWGGYSLAYCVKNGLIEPIDFIQPDDTATSEWVAHIDAGTKSPEDPSDDFSYLTTEWICFCTGQYTHNQVWNWVILPPKQLIVDIAKCA